MLEMPHVVVGAAVASKVPNPLIALPLAFASHLVLDLVPHWNPHLNTEMKKHGKLSKNTMNLIVLDVASSLIIGSSVAYSALPDKAHALTILGACFAAALPDLMESPYYLFGIKNKLIKQWIKFQKVLQNDAEPLFGIATQAIVVAASFFWMLN